MTTEPESDEAPAPLPYALMAEEPAPPRRSRNSWMVIFADVLALLLTFFVMMYAMNDVRQDEWQGFVNAMAGRFSPASPPADFKVRDGLSDTSVFEPRGMDLGYLESLISAQLSDTNAAGAYEVVRQGDKIVIRLPDVLTIEDGQPALTEGARTAARELGQALGTLRNRVSVAGHAAKGTEGTPYPSAWELSLAAATIAADAIRAAGFERELRVVGHGKAQLTTTASSAADKAEKWGRVDVVVRAGQAERGNDEN